MSLSGNSSTSFLGNSVNNLFKIHSVVPSGIPLEEEGIPAEISGGIRERITGEISEEIPLGIPEGIMP